MADRSGLTDDLRAMVDLFDAWANDNEPDDHGATMRLGDHVQARPRADHDPKCYACWQPWPCGPALAWRQVIAIRRRHNLGHPDGCHLRQGFGCHDRTGNDRLDECRGCTCGYEAGGTDE